MIPQNAELPNFISRRVIRGRYLFLDLTPSKSKKISLTCSGWEDCSPGYEIHRNGFRYWAVEYIAGGSWEFSHEGKKTILCPGTFFTYGPSTVYSLKALSGSGLSKYFIDFSGKDAGRLLAKSGLEPGCFGRLVHRRWLQDLLDQIIDTARLPASTRGELSDMLMNLFLKRIPMDFKTDPIISSSRKSYERCRTYLAENYLKIQSLNSAARSCGVSSAHLSRLFQRYDTESPKVCLMRLKMNHAAELIIRGNLQVKNACAEVGFDDPYHFSRCFKRVHGVSPSHFGKWGPSSGIHNT